MKLFRLASGKNSFSLVGLSLGKLSAIQRSLELNLQAETLGPVGEEALEELKALHLDKVDMWGISHTEEEPRRRSKQTD